MQQEFHPGILSPATCMVPLAALALFRLVLDTARWLKIGITISLLNITAM
jgi:hypothetical protein